ncbi:MAG: ATP-binding protein [Deltaproteobacteria bacterium]|uniref:ATP-binding protein n=1 Tax=Desulfobacula sp. TaxID=2593537 RepID=UPI0019BCC06E|nr:ATP-binding protein [Candidatus Desulfobacula maris]MBL6992405.1 ATP-binding protein [Desulfobacula sp.]
MYTRKSELVLREMLNEFRILYLTGPRQAGKTTLARKIANDTKMQYVSLDDQTAFTSAQYDPHGFIDSLKNRPVVLDEFQYAPELIKAIKLASDLLPVNKRGQFFLTGSADIFKSARTQEALPGHMARMELYPLSVTEKTGSDFNLIDFLSAEKLSLPDNLPVLSRGHLAQELLDGGYPELQGKGPRARQIWFQSYLQGRLFKDFDSIYSAKGEYHTKLEALIPYLAGLCGNLLKYASIANDLGQNDKIIKSYVEALEWMFIVKRIHPYVKNRARRQSIGMAKLHMVDTGLACYLLGLKKKQQLLDSPFYGGVLESFFVMECYKHMMWAKETMSLYHFRDKRKNEVDIVLEQADGRLIGIEVKASDTIRQNDFKGLKKLAELTMNQFKYGLVFYTGSRLMPFGDGCNLYFAVPLSILF